VAAGKNRGISEAGTRVADRGVKLPRASPHLLEGNPEFEEIQADDEQHIAASTIRQTVPSTCSSTAPNRRHPAKNPWSAAYPALTRNAALIPLLPMRSAIGELSTVLNAFRQGLASALNHAGD